MSIFEQYLLSILKCGAYCVGFIHWVNNDVAFKNFLNHFEEGDLLSNDKKLRKYFKGMLFKV